MPKLIICQDAQDYRVVEFTSSVTIGREEDNDITLFSPLVSRHHASIRQQDDGYVLFDHQSTNAVWMEGKKVNEVQMVHGKSFRIVDYLFTFIEERNNSCPSHVFACQSGLPAEGNRSFNSTTILFNQEQDFVDTPLGPTIQLLSEADGDMASLRRFFLELHEIDTESVLSERLLAVAVELFRAKRGFLALINEKNELIYVQTHCFDPHLESQDIRQDIVQQVMERSRAGTRKAGCDRKRLVLCAPLLRADKAIGCLYLDRGAKDFFSENAHGTLEILALFGAVLLDNLTNRKRMHREQESLKARLATKNETIIRSEKMVKLYEDIRTIAPINVPVFISGEAGTGKEHIAAALHSFSKRKGAYIPLNCSAIPDALFESELFGSKKGAFHEAVDKPGKLELADGGTLFLDEVADMSLALQPKLLRFLENGEVSRLGDNRARKLEVRVVTATNRDVAVMIQENTFRDDLFQRLSCFTLKVPPLRERVDDIEPLARYFLKKFSAEYNWREPRVSDNGMQILCQYHWPGNIRQLRNVVLRLAVQSQGKVITEREIFALSEGLGSTEAAKVDIFPSLEEMEKNHIQAALDRVGGNILDAAELVGIARSTLYVKMKKYNISAQ